MACYGTRTVATARDLKQLVADYLDFSEFSFDVETAANRKVRGLRAPRLQRGHSRDTDLVVCPSCGRRFPRGHNRKWCTDTCRDAAEKDKPALDPMTNLVWSISLAGPGRCDVVPCGHPDPRPQLRPADVCDALEPLFFSDRRKVNQNVAFDLLSISKFYDGTIPPPPYGDTMMLAFLLNENLPEYKLGTLSQEYLGFRYGEKLGEEAYYTFFEKAIRYSIIDAQVAWQIWHKLRKKYRKLPKLQALLDLEMDVLGVLMHMRQHGAYVNVEEFYRLWPDLVARQKEREEEAHRLIDPVFGGRINLNSTQQLGRYFYDIKGLRCRVYTDKGARSTNVQALQGLARRDPAAKAILDYREYAKLISTYVAGYIPTIDPDGRIRASFNQTVAKTGRLSCSGPNLQNIPARHKESFEATMIRQLFVAPPGYQLIVADYSQIELRILAHQTRDPRLLHAYREEIDLHLQTAALIWQIPPEKVNGEQRAMAKNCNFNFAFEGGPGRVMELSGVSEAEATVVWEAWHRAYPGVKRWGRSVKDFCRTHGYVETLYGRKRRLPDINSSENNLKFYSERQAVNHPIQGSAADIAKIGIVQVFEALRGLDAHLVLQIHDEFIIECAEADVERALPLVREAMENVRLGDRPVLDVPLIANISVGNNWAECK